MKNKKLMYIIIAVTVVLLSVAGYLIYKNTGTYSDIAGEWKVERDYSSKDEEDYSMLLNKMLDQVGEELDLPNTETLKITRNGQVTIIANGLNLRKSEASYSLPKEREKNADMLPLTFELSKIEESPLYNKFFPSLLEKLVGYNQTELDKEDLADYKEMLDKSQYSKQEMKELTTERKEYLEEDPDIYKKLSISGDKLTYEFHQTKDNETEIGFKIVNKNKIEFIAEDGETVLGTYIRK
ncbi:hypothetical protein [Isobaculum melis]|uniref:Uncharacterized protein n=1 Tax=Isobaculum melis TaxID=142588 RepID=A0A1H9RTK2_9LACT|nr:hypothetical protein [Isobaculum melis]SER75249.1 hypothetical protein SAMN04488559_10517 [Isobaculum melis]